MLQDGTNYPSGFLVQLLISPVGVDVTELCSNFIVSSQPNGVQSYESRLLIDTLVSCIETPDMTSLAPAQVCLVSRSR